MPPRSFIPFFYFQQTRLNNRRAWVFHAVYEWLPAFFIVSIYYYYTSGFDLIGIRIINLLLYFLAFISFYEIGYLVNDQLAHNEIGGRKRSDRLSVPQIALFIAIRIFTFIGITIYLHHQDVSLWWGWYALLAVLFALHNSIRLLSLKVVTFCFLALVRFFSPIFMILTLPALKELLFPVFLNYVLFRLFMYMDSKNLLQSFERKTNSYRVGFYLLNFGFANILTLLYQSWIPAGIGLYYLLGAMLFALRRSIIGLTDR
jgi:hypothetical protein